MEQRSTPHVAIADASGLHDWMQARMMAVFCRPALIWARWSACAIVENAINAHLGTRSSRVRHAVLTHAASPSVNTRPCSGTCWLGEETYFSCSGNDAALHSEAVAGLDSINLLNVCAHLASCVLPSETWPATCAQQMQEFAGNRNVRFFTL